MHGVARDEHKVVDGVLVVRFIVGDHGRKRYFAPRSRRRGNGNEQRQATMHAQKAAHLVDGLARLGDTCAHALGAVHGRASAKADDGAAAVLAVQCSGFLYVRDRGICLGICVNGAVDSHLRERGLEPVSQTEPGDAGVRHQQDRADALVGQYLRNLIGRMHNFGFIVRKDRHGKTKHGLIDTAPCFIGFVHGLLPGCSLGQAGEQGAAIPPSLMAAWRLAALLKHSLTNQHSSQPIVVL